MVQRDTGRNFTKTGDDLLRTNVPHRAKFHRAAPNDEREMRYNFLYTLQYFGASGTLWAKIDHYWP